MVYDVFQLQYHVSNSSLRLTIYIVANIILKTGRVRSYLWTHNFHSVPTNLLNYDLNILTFDQVTVILGGDHLTEEMSPLEIL